MSTPRPVVVSLQELRDDQVSFDRLQEAFGPESLGILLVREVGPEYAELRHRLLSYASYMGNLEKHDLESFTNAKAKYLVGWSRGRERLASGGADDLKGSFYANCTFNGSTRRGTGPAMARFDPDNFPEYLAPNSWPPDRLLPGFRPVMERLCGLIIDTAVLVARACDRFAERDMADYPPGYLEKMLRSSSTTKARLLHYYPVPVEGQARGDGNNKWCASHKDHGCLTGLTSAMFIDENSTDGKVPDLGDAVPDSLPALEELAASPDPQAGLWIKSRKGEAVQVEIPRDCIAFQTGEALERITRGKLRAVEHFVRGARAKGVARNTLAIFVQPNLEDEVDLDQHITFGDFARGIIAKNTV